MAESLVVAFPLGIGKTKTGRHHEDIIRNETLMQQFIKN